jgi:hypothetical protein
MPIAAGGQGDSIAGPRQAWGDNSVSSCRSYSQPEVLALVQVHFLCHFPVWRGSKGSLEEVPRGPTGPPGPLELAAPRQAVSCRQGLHAPALQLGGVDRVHRAYLKHAGFASAS